MEEQMLAHTLEQIPILLILIGLFVFSLVAFGVYSAVLLWHWRKYSTGKFTTISNMTTYASVGGGLIITMFLSILWYAYV